MAFTEGIMHIVHHHKDFDPESKSSHILCVKRCYVLLEAFQSAVIHKMDGHDGCYMHHKLVYSIMKNWDRDLLTQNCQYPSLHCCYDPDSTCRHRIDYAKAKAKRHTGERRVDRQHNRKHCWTLSTECSTSQELAYSRIMEQKQAEKARGLWHG